MEPDKEFDLHLLLKAQEIGLKICFVKLEYHKKKTLFEEYREEGE